MSILENYLHLLIKKKYLTREEAKKAMAHIVQDADPYQASAFLSLLKFRGEYEIALFALKLNQIIIEQNMK